MKTKKAKRKLDSSSSDSDAKNDKVKKQEKEQEKGALVATFSSLQHGDAQTLSANAFTMLQEVLDVIEASAFLCTWCPEKDEL